MNRWRIENGELRILLIILFSAVAWAESFNEIRMSIENSLKYKLAKKKVEIYKEKLKSVMAKNYGKIDLNYNAIHFFNNPEMKLTMAQPVAINPTTNTLIYKEFDTSLPMSDNDHFIGSLTYSYPIFTGYGITNLISKSKLELIKAKLELNNVKRELLLSAAKLYSAIYATKANINALNAAKEALISAKEKARGFYNAGLINKASLDEIDAKYYEVVADIKRLKAQKISLLNSLSYLINKKIEKIDGLIDLNRLNFNPKFENRPDVAAIKETLKITQKDIDLAKSKLYPQIYFQIGLKREADNFILSRNEYQNIDKSYGAISIEYNIFDGGEKKAQIEMAKLQKISSAIFLRDYLEKVKSEYYSDKSQYNALFFRLKAAIKEIEARNSYYEVIRAKFFEGLADSTDLNDAIAKLAAAKAKRDAIKAEIFFLNVKLRLNGGEYEY